MVIRIVYDGIRYTTVYRIPSYSIQYTDYTVNPPKHSVKVLDFHVVLQAGGPLEALGTVGTLLMGEGKGVALVL